MKLARKLALGIEIMGAYARARWSLRRGGLRGALVELRAPGTAPKSPGLNPVWDGLRLGRAVSRTLALVPAESRCLTQSLVLTRLLAVRGLDSRLVIAVRPGERLAAHAWVEHDGVPLLPDGGATYDELVTL
jgi:hypothetical protein